MVREQERTLGGTWGRLSFAMNERTYGSLLGGIRSSTSGDRYILSLGVGFFLCLCFALLLLPLPLRHFSFVGAYYLRAVRLESRVSYPGGQWTHTHTHTHAMQRDIPGNFGYVRKRRLD